MCGAGCSFGSMRLLSVVLEVRRRAEEDCVATGGGWADNALVTNPSRGRGYIFVFAELRLVLVILICIVLNVGICKYFDPGAGALHDDDLVSRSDKRDLLRVGVGGNIDVRIMQHSGPRSFVVLLGPLLGPGLALYNSRR